MSKTVLRALGLIFIAGCSALSPIAIHLMDGEVLVSLGCERDRVAYVEVSKWSETKPDTEVVLWRIEAGDQDQGAPLEEFTIGVVPSGFVETHPYADKWTGGFISLETINPRGPEYNGGSSAGFEVGDGSDGWRYEGLDPSEPDGTWEEFQEWVTSAGNALGGWECP